MFSIISNLLRFKDVNNPNELQKKPMILLIDADNTLWNTHEIYTGLFEQLIDLISGEISFQKCTKDLSSIRWLDRKIASFVGTYDYNPQLLFRAFVNYKLEGNELQNQKFNSLIKNPDCNLSPKIFHNVNKLFRTLDHNAPNLIPYAREFLTDLKHNLKIELILITEAPYLRVMNILALHNLYPFFDQVFSLKKNEESLRRAVNIIRPDFNFSENNHHVVVVGDSLEHDIRPAARQ